MWAVFIALIRCCFVIAMLPSFFVVGLCVLLSLSASSYAYRVVSDALTLPRAYIGGGDVRNLFFDVS